MRSFVWLLLMMMIIQFNHACVFPDFTQITNDTHPWYSHVKHDRSWSKMIVIQGSSLSIKDSKRNETIDWNCTVALRDHYMVQVQVDKSPNDMVFACVKFYKRSMSIIQIAWSPTSNTLDPETMCDDTNMNLDPWMLVAYQFINDDFSECPMSGGYNMKIKDSNGIDSPCNLMDLPMRLESDCLAGEGVLFDYRSNNCVPDVDMHQSQRTICVAAWSDEKSHFTILRRHNDHLAWCLKVSRLGHEVLNGVLLSDLACFSDKIPANTKVLLLSLERVLYPKLCADEYPECADMLCNPYTKKQCMKTCRACDTRRPPAICSFPREFRGIFSLIDRDGFKNVEISESILSVDNVGKFQCSVFPGSPISVMGGYYTAVTISENGCRPRYTCIHIRRLGPSVLAYSLSQSIIWPTVDQNLGATICKNRQFSADLDPISDTYRSHLDTQKPVIAQYPKPMTVDCNLTSAYSVHATFTKGDTCSGSLYVDCIERSNLRIDFNKCKAAPLKNAYKCLAVFEGQYWEKMVLVQSMTDKDDARCIVFNSFRKKEAMMLLAGECDKLSWRFAKNSVRKSLLTLQIEREIYPCKTLLKVDGTNTSLKMTKERGNDASNSHLVTVDPSPQVMTPKRHPAPPSRPQIDDSYHHVTSVHSGGCVFIKQCGHELLIFGYLLSKHYY